MVEPPTPAPFPTMTLPFPPSHPHLRQPLDQCFGQVKLMYYEEMTWARARDFNNVSLASWIEAFERALEKTLGHPTAGPRMIKHSYNGQTGIYPCDPQICIDRINERQSLRESKLGTHAQRIPQVPTTTDQAVLDEMKRYPRKRVLAQLELVNRGEAEGEDEEGKETGGEGKVKRRYIELPRTFGDGDTYDHEVRLKDAHAAAKAEEKKKESERKLEERKRATAERNAEKEAAKQRLVAERKARLARERRAKKDAAEATKARKARQRGAISEWAKQKAKEKKAGAKKRKEEKKKGKL